MGKDTTIAWCDHTFNCWWGCTKISPGCKHCYAATFDKRVHGKDSEHWKPDGPRRFFGDKHWNQPLKWNRDAEKAGVRRRVFCASMADVFEDRRDLDEHRVRLWHLIKRTPWLDWLLLTKRPENLRAMLPWTCIEGDASWGTLPWHNVWVGTTTEDQEHADRRIPLLLAVPAVVRFLSVEPMIGPVDLSAKCPPHYAAHLRADRIGWVIVGCESGHGARPAQVQWYRALRDQCAAAGVPFLLKQAEESFAAPIDGDVIARIGAGPGSSRKGRSLIEAPYLDGVQHLEFPK